MRSTIVTITILLTFSCSIKKIIVGSMSDSLTSTSSVVFTGEEDPELLQDAFPFILKMQELLLEQSKNSPDKYLSTGKSFIIYANLFVHTPATMLSDDNFTVKESQQHRAKKLYKRGINYIISGIELSHPGFRKSFFEGKAEPFLQKFSSNEVSYLYWLGAGWMGAYSINPMDTEIGVLVPQSISILIRALTLDEKFEKGAIHELLAGIYGSLPKAMGGSKEKSIHHFKKSVSFANNEKITPYVTLATTLATKDQKRSYFKELLTKALDFDIDSAPEQRLTNTIAQRKAKWYLDHIDDFFLNGE